MKQLNIYFISTIILIFLLFPSMMAFAATATPSSTPKISTASATTKKIEDLKDRLATKVAELRQTSRRAIHGTVKSTSITSFVVETKTKDVKIEMLDEIKVIQMLKGKRTILSTDAIAKGDVVTVFGEHDATLDLLKATIVFIQGAIPTRVSGIVSARDDAEFILTISTPQNQIWTIDIERATKTLAWDRAKKEIIKSGFSKIAVGASLHIVGFPIPKKENRISADRILDLGNLAAPGDQVATSTPTPTEKPASPSATPTKKPTPTSTP